MGFNSVFKGLNW